MIVAQTPPRFHPYVGGVENYALNLCKELSKKHDVKVFCADEGGKGVKKVGNIKVFRHRTLFKIANTNVTQGFAKTLREQDFDLMHTYLPTPYSCDLSVKIAEEKGVPSIVSYCNDVVGSNPLTSVAASAYNKFVLRRTLRDCDKIVVINPDYARMSPHLKSFRHKVEFIPVGVDNDKFVNKRQGRKSRRIGFLSLLDESHEYKGLPVLLRALKQVPNTELVVGGEGRLKEHYQKKCEQLGISDRVAFKGFIPENELASFYSSLDAFVLPTTSSKQEGFGMVLVEAMMCGANVVTTSEVGMQAFLKENGFGKVVKPGSANALAEAIKKTLNNPEKIDRKMLVQNFGKQAVAKKFEKLYEELL